MLISHLIIANIGVILALRSKGRFHKIIAFGIAICVALPFLGNGTITTISLVMFGLMALLTLLYGVKELNLTKTDRIGIALTGLVIATSTFMKFQHLSGAGVTRVLMIIPIASMIIILIKNKVVTKEVSFMLYWAFYSITELLPLFDQDN